MATVTVDRSNLGGTVVANVGDTIEIRLAENPTTGFRWAVESVDRRLALEHDDYAPAADGGVGGGGQRLLRYKANEAGSVPLQLKLQRAWEGDASTSDRFAVTVDIRP